MTDFAIIRAECAGNMVTQACELIGNDRPCALRRVVAFQTGLRTTRTNEFVIVLVAFTTVGFSRAAVSNIFRINDEPCSSFFIRSEIDIS